MISSELHYLCAKKRFVHRAEFLCVAMLLLIVAL